MRGETVVFLFVLGLFVAIEAALAQGGDPRCKDPYAACGGGVSRQCLLRMGAGAEALSAAGPAADECAGQLTQYQSCLAEIAEVCAPPPSASDDARSPREKLAALGRKFAIDDYLAAANDEDWPALDLFHEAGFLKSAKRACNVVDIVFRGRVSGSTERIAAALPKEAISGDGCASYVAEQNIRPMQMERMDVEGRRPGPVYIFTAACLLNNLVVNRNCGRNDLAARLMKKAELRDVIAPRLKALDRTEQALKDKRRRVEICVAVMSGETRFDPNDPLELGVASGRVGVGSQSVFGSLRAMGRYDFNARRYCLKGVGEKSYIRAIGNVGRARERLKRFVAFGG